MAFQYSVTVNNQASSSAYLMVYQNDPTSWDPNALSIAWFSKYSNPSATAKVVFKWTIDWGFAWADTGTLEEGVDFLASETYDPTTGLNQVSLDYNGAYLFTDYQKGSDTDRFYLKETGNIPVKATASVGMTMSGSTVYATQAQPNQNLTFSPKPSYYLAYGSYYEGQVIDVSTINNPLQLSYPTGVYSLTTTLNADNSWSDPGTLVDANTEYRSRIRAA